MPKIKYIGLLFFAILGYLLNAQLSQAKIDSLNDEISYNESDSNKIKAALELGEHYYYHTRSFKESSTYFKYARDKSLKPNYQYGLCESYNGIGVIYYHLGAMDSALIQWQKALDIAKQGSNKKIIGDIYNNIAFIYKSQNRLDSALSYHDKSIAIKKETSDYSSLAGAYNNKGKILIVQKKYKKALHVFKLASKNIKKSNTKRQLSNLYLNTGLSYFYLENLDSALYYYKRALNINIKKKQQTKIAHTYHNYGLYYHKINKLDSAELMFKNALKVFEKKEDLISMKKSQEALLRLHEAKEDYIAAYHSSKKLSMISGKIKDIDIKNQLIINDLTNEHAKEKAQIAAEREKEQLYLIASLIAIGFLIVLAALLFYLNKLRQNKNRIISLKSKEVEEKNKNISDSLKYAERIQNSILPNQDFLNKALKNPIILYLPKDIVSGDFYWYHQIDNYKFIGLADCTGHGVPGALMSMIGKSGLDNAVLQGCKTPCEILNSLQEFVTASFTHGEQLANIKDGMDIALCRLNTDTLHLKISSAMSKIYLVRNENLIQLHGEPHPIGSAHYFSDYKDKDIPLLPNDIIYMFTDGYADQFGGKLGKKLKYNRFRKLILQNALLDQKNGLKHLIKNFKRWKGSHEQIDDISIIRFKV